LNKTSTRDTNQLSLIIINDQTNPIIGSISPGNTLKKNPKEEIN